MQLATHVTSAARPLAGPASPPSLPPALLAQSPKQVLLPGRLYTFCIWARVAPGTATAGSVLLARMELHGAAGPVPAASPVSVAATGVYTRFCISGVQVVVETAAMLRLSLTAAGTYHLDDYSVEHISAPQYAEAHRRRLSQAEASPGALPQ